MIHALVTITLRPATPYDAWAIRRLFAALHDYNAALDPRFALAEGWEQILDEHLTHMWAAGHSLTLIGWDGERPIGLLMMDGHSDSPLFRHRHWAELLALYVVPEAQGGGMADMLLDAGITWAQERGYERVQLYVTASNLRARRFYRRTGFQPVQEIWRRELGASSGAPPDDPECETTYQQGHDLLAIHPHQIRPKEPPECPPV